MSGPLFEALPVIPVTRQPIRFATVDRVLLPPAPARPLPVDECQRDGMGYCPTAGCACCCSCNPDPDDE